jgi:hypothetical protein
MQLQNEITSRYSHLEIVEAVAMAGSCASGKSDAASHIDLYVYVTGELTLQQRESVATKASRKEIGNAFWEPGDEWIENGISVDVMFRQTGWIEEQLDRVLVLHQAFIGYSTCFWYNVLHSEAMFDRHGWFRQLQARTQVSYPQQLKQNVIAKNWPILSDNLSSYRHQIELALHRGDLGQRPASCNSAAGQLFRRSLRAKRSASSGEKRLLPFVESLCPIRPQQMKAQLERVVSEPSLAAVDEIVNGLRDSLACYLPQPPRPLKTLTHLMVR